MKVRRVLDVLAIYVLAIFAIIAALSVCAVAQEQQDEVMYKGQLYCVGQEDCRAFAFWVPTLVAPLYSGYVELLESAGGPVSDYIWVDYTGSLYFESDNENGGFALLPPSGLPLLGTLVENGQFQEVDQFFRGGSSRPLFVLSDVDTPEPSTLLLFGPAALFLFNRARRFGRS